MLDRLAERYQRKADDLQIVLDSREMEREIGALLDQYEVDLSGWSAEIAALDKEFETTRRLGKAQQELDNWLNVGPAINHDEAWCQVSE